jgi:type VI secretion system protein ImpA
MSGSVDLEAILRPIPGDSPAGADLRYEPVYEEIREARRVEDPLAAGEGESKRADWERVRDLSAEALTAKSKDLQIAAWLTEALLRTEGFQGFAAGLKALTGLLDGYWETVYPVPEEGDLEYRAGPIEFLNEKLWLLLRSVPVTDPRASDGYSLLQYDESRTVGYEKDTLNQHGDTDEGKAAKRKEMLAEGKLSAELFDAAMGKSSPGFYASLAEGVTACREAFDAFEQAVDARFGREAPRLAELRKAIEECQQFVNLRVGGSIKGAPLRTDRETSVPPIATGHGAGEIPGRVSGQAAGREAASSPSPSRRAGIADTVAFEDELWQEALGLLESANFKKALELLIQESYTAPSVRERNRLRLLMAKLCLRAERPDLARPLIEELHALIQELHLEKWESPLWVADVLNTLYLCLTSGEPSDEDEGRAKTLFQQMCTTDVTRAMSYKR